jgi:probable F420-dependent oxidoreductase
MRLGLATPGVVQMPGVAGNWEATATADDLAAIAMAADGLGFDFLTCSEHVALPLSDRAARGDVYWDPLATLGFLAAHTTRIRLATSVLVLGYHHPLEIAKRYGTLDRISGGRLVLGVGVGSLAAEFELLGASFADRGERADDSLRALRASMSTPEPAYDGRYFSYSGISLRPFALQPRVPIWVGGRTRRSLRRAVQLADGWMPFGLGVGDIAAMLAGVELPDGFDLVLATGGTVDPTDEPDRTRCQLEELNEVGATAVTCSVRARSAEQYVEQLSALCALAHGLEGDRQ